MPSYYTFTAKDQAIEICNESGLFSSAWPSMTLCFDINAAFITLESSTHGIPTLQYLYFEEVIVYTFG
jgi:hypothetical protein